MLEISRYSERVKVLAKSVTTSMTGGEVRGAPVVTAQRYAHVVPQTSRRWQQMQTAYVEMRAAFEFREPTQVKVGDMIDHAGRRYEVIGIATERGLPPDQAYEITVVCRGIDS